MHPENQPFSSLRFVPPGPDAETARLQERVRVMEATVGEFRGDLKEIKVAIQLILGHHLKVEKTVGAWQFLVGPCVWAVIGAALMFVFALHRGV